MKVQTHCDWLTSSLRRSVSRLRVCYAALAYIVKAAVILWRPETGVQCKEEVVSKCVDAQQRCNISLEVFNSSLKTEELGISLEVKEIFSKDLNAQIRALHTHTSRITTRQVALEHALPHAAPPHDVSSDAQARSFDRRLFENPCYVAVLTARVERIACSSQQQNAQLLSFLQPLVLPLLRRVDYTLKSLPALQHFLLSAQDTLLNRLRSVQRQVHDPTRGVSSTEQRVSPREPTVDDVKAAHVIYKALQSVASVCCDFQYDTSQHLFLPQNPQWSLRVLSNQQSDLTTMGIPEVVRTELSKRLSELTAEIQLYVSESSSHSGAGITSTDSQPRVNSATGLL